MNGDVSAHTTPPYPRATRVNIGFHHVRSTRVWPLKGNDRRSENGASDIPQLPDTNFRRLSYRLKLIRTDPRTQLRFGIWLHTLWWTSLFVLHVVNIVYYAGVAWLYRQFGNTFLEHQLKLYSIGIDNSEYSKVSRLHACVAAVHVFFVLLMITSSIRERKPVFQPDFSALYRALKRVALARRLTSNVTRLNRTTSSTSSPSSIDCQTAPMANSARRSESVARSSAFSREGLFGVDSVYFDHMLLVRELIETSLQTYQLYRMTLVMPRLWLIRFYLALLIINCWVVPFLHRYYHNHKTLRRLLCLFCDAVLDMISSIGVSFIIFATYAPQYNDPAGFGFPRTIWYDDEWFANMQQEFRIMLVVSWGDLGSRLVFAVGLLMCIEEIKELLTPVADPPTSMQTLPLVPWAIESDVLQTDAVTRKGRVLDKGHKKDIARPTVKTKTPKLSPGKRLSVLSFLLQVVGPGFFVVWGCILLAVHLAAESRHNESPCSLRLKPWLTSKPGCSLVEMNCALIQSKGDDEAIKLIWEAFDPNRAASVVIRHCPQLLIPTKIKQYHWITTLKLYNSTIVGWDDAAALATTDHPNLRSIYLVRTFTPTGELPLGLQSSNFPKRVVNFLSSVTNFSTLPGDLYIKWPKRMQLGFEFSSLTRVPKVLRHLVPRLISFSGSPISAIPVEILEMPQLDTMLAAKTRIQELPRHVKSINPQFRTMMLQFTNVTEFWSWIDPFAHYIASATLRLFNAYGTPYCRELLEIANGTRKAFSVAPEQDHSILMDVSTPEKLAFAMRVVECTKRDPMMYFALGMEDAKHRWKQDGG